jgi:hypothetical protein
MGDVVEHVKRDARRVRLVVMLGGVAALLAAGCGSSTTQSVTSPSTDARCNLTVSVDPQPLEASGGARTLTIGINRECAWTARSEADWIALGANPAGQGNGSLPFSVAGNGQVTARRGGILVNATRVEVSQAGAPCVYTLGATSRTVDAGGDRYVVPVSAQPGCSWTATSTAPWVTVGDGAAGSGPGSVTLVVAPNGGAARTGAVTMAGLTHAVFQTAADAPTPPTPNPPPAGCAYELSAGVQPVGAAGGDGGVSIYTTATCPWTAASDIDWVSIVGSSAGTGPSVVRFLTSANPSTSARIGTLAIAGRVLTVTQVGATPPTPNPPTPNPPTPNPPTPNPPEPPPCTFTVAPESVAIDAAAASTPISVTASAASCAWTATSGAAWVTTSSLGGSGTGDLRVSATANTSTTTRTATVTIAGRAVTVTQAGAAEPPAPPPACTFTASPGSQTVAATGAPGQVAIGASASTCGWTATSSAAWLTITAGASGTGPGSVVFTAAANTAAVTRSATITAAGITVTVNQEAAAPPPPPPCTFTASPGSQTVAATGASGQVAIGASASTCGWTASSSAAWLTITAGASGTGPGAVAFTAAANSATVTRSATITAAGVTVTVNQEAAAPPPPPPCTFALSRTEISVAAIDISESVTVTTQAGCAWTAQSHVAWITISQGASGTGSGEVRFNVALHVGLTRRTGTMTIAGQTVTVSQAGLLGAGQP